MSLKWFRSLRPSNNGKGEIGSPVSSFGLHTARIGVTVHTQVSTLISKDASVPELVDTVAIHCLNVHYTKTWTEEKARVNWLLTGGNAVFAIHPFWDEQLSYDIEALSPYSENIIVIITSADDSIFPNEAATIEPMFNYVQLSDDLRDGLSPWITVAINVTASYTECYIFALTEDGGEAVTAAM
ncbi:putative Intradiol ring-cleavage dioxygenase [Seiridium cardinale]|uniref:Intradiol ring-cleavage dioxygenase n=1 Tax=Seiridium cardinale TaxID=138064 RepID=A0ABR2XKA2_9PEZI